MLAPIAEFFADLIPTPKFSNITFWKSQNKKYLYYCLSETHIQDESKFLKVFPGALRVSQTEFDILIFFFPDRKVVEVGDAEILDELNTMQVFENDGAYAEDEK